MRGQRGRWLLMGLRQRYGSDFRGSSLRLFFCLQASWSNGFMPLLTRSHYAIRRLNF
jgi:hypothetical protein